MRQTERLREREGGEGGTDRQTDRDRQGLRERETDRQINRHTDRARKRESVTLASY